MQATIRNTAYEDFPDVERFQRRKNEGLLAPPDVVARHIMRIVENKSLEFGSRYEV